MVTPLYSKLHVAYVKHKGNHISVNRGYACRAGALGTSTIVWSIVPALDDECGAVGGMIGKRNRNTRRKPATWPDPSSNRDAMVESRRLAV
jgi:hypothetical protein